MSSTSWPSQQLKNLERNELEYTGAVDVPASETEDLIVAVGKLQKSVEAWLSTNRPELLEAGE